MYPRPDFFAGSLLNFAENLLYPANLDIPPSSTAVIEANELGHVSVSWAELRERVRQCAASLQSLGVQKDDRVAGFLANHTNTLVAMLAATSMGAIWTGVSPDTGVGAVLDRLVQIEPVVLFADNAVVYNGRAHGSAEKTRDIVQGLKGRGLKAVVVFETVKGFGEWEKSVKELADDEKGLEAFTYDDFVNMYVAFPLTLPCASFLVSTLSHEIGV
jgi:acetoacetyl-CoA synthetase